MSSKLLHSLSSSHAYSQHTRSIFQSLQSSSTASSFIASNQASLFKTLQHKVLSNTFLGYGQSDFDINGTLDMYPLHLFNESQISSLLPPSHSSSSSSSSSSSPFALLDVGAGAGAVTATLASTLPAHATVTATETSPVMAGLLSDRGYEVWGHDIASPPAHVEQKGESFDLVSMLNVIDRTPRPLSLLRAAHRLLKPNGHVLLATPLPFRPFFFAANHKGAQVTGYATKRHGKPVESLALREGGSWDEQCQYMLEKALPALGLAPVAFSRLPYVSGGDYFKPEGYVLDDLVVVARKIEPAEPPAVQR